MSSTHSFSVAVAQKVGMREAVFLNHFSYWHIQNKANGKHFHDGRYWTYNSVRGFAELYPYLTGKEIRSTLDSLEKANLITTGNYNVKGMDRTKWYALTLQSSEIMGVFVNPADLPTQANGVDQQAETICPTGQNHLPTQAIAFAPEGKALPLLEDITKTVKEVEREDAGIEPEIIPIEIDLEEELSPDLMAEYELQMKTNRVWIEKAAMTFKRPPDWISDHITAYIETQRLIDNALGREYSDVKRHCYYWMKEQNERQLRDDKRTNQIPGNAAAKGGINPAGAKRTAFIPKGALRRPGT